MLRPFVLILLAGVVGVGCRSTSPNVGASYPFVPGDSYDLKELPSTEPGEVFTFQIRTGRDVKVTVGADMDGESFTLYSQDVRGGQERMAISFLLSDSKDKAGKTFATLQGLAINENKVMIEATSWLQPQNGEPRMNRLYKGFDFARPVDSYFIVARGKKGQEFGRKRVIARWVAPNVSAEVERTGSGFNAGYRMKSSGEMLNQDQVHEATLFLIVDLLPPLTQ